MAEDLFEYCSNPVKVKREVQQYRLPRVSGNCIGFQVISQNMEPTIMVSSIVFGEEVSLEEIKKNSVYILHTTTKGIYVSRFFEKVNEYCFFINDNMFSGKVEFLEEEIIHVFKVKNMYSEL